MMKAAAKYEVLAIHMLTNRKCSPVTTFLLKRPQVAYLSLLGIKINLKVRGKAPEISFVFFMLSQALYTGHKYVIIAKDLIQDQATEVISKAGIFLWIQLNYHHWNTQSLPCPWGKTQEPILQGVLHYVLIRGPHCQVQTQSKIS